MTSDQKLIHAALEQSGLPRKVFAETIMVRDERTITRWIYGEVEIPEVARRKLRAIIDGHDA